MGGGGSLMHGTTRVKEQRSNGSKLASRYPTYRHGALVAILSRIDIQVSQEGAEHMGAAGQRLDL